MKGLIVYCLLASFFASSHSFRRGQPVLLTPLSPRARFGGYPYYGWFLDDIADEHFEERGSKTAKAAKRGKIISEFVVLVQMGLTNRIMLLGHGEKGNKTDPQSQRKTTMVAQIKSYINEMGVE